MKGRRHRVADLLRRLADRVEEAGPRRIVWPNGVTWPGNVAVDLAAPAGPVIVRTDDGGRTWRMELA